MLEKPDLPDEKIIACLRDSYALNITQVDFLPLGADMNTAVYRILTDDAIPYFLKLRSGMFDEMSVIVPAALHQGGIAQIIAPIATRSGQLWSHLQDFAVILYPFIDGHNGYEASLSDQHWIEFGRALKQLHTAVLPPSVMSHIQREGYSGKWRDMVKDFQAQVEDTVFSDSVAREVATLLKSKQPVVNYLVNRAEQLASLLQSQSSEFVVCHADIHAANMLITADGTFYIVDWDTLILAPKERDLMFVGGGQYGDEHTPQEEEALFYQGYGQTEVNPVARLYYLYERIVQDIAAYCEQLLLTDEGGADRSQGLRYLSSNFQPNQVIDIACQSEKRLPPELQSEYKFNPGL